MSHCNRVFVISDTHFGHKKVLEFEKGARAFASIQEHDDELVYRWNNTVRKHDTVWHLGDVLFGAESFETLRRLNGVKKLVMGNHDQYPVEKYREHFSQIYGTVKVQDCILSHVPVHPSQFYRFVGNIHGHLHSHVIDDPRYCNVSCEQIDLTPVLMDKVVHTLKERNDGTKDY